MGVGGGLGLERWSGLALGESGSLQLTLSVYVSVVVVPEEVRVRQ